jgi:hypothetical protein
MAYFLVMLLTLMHIVYLTLKLTNCGDLWGHFRRNHALVLSCLWMCRWSRDWWEHLCWGRWGRRRLGWSRANSTDYPSRVGDDYFSSRPRSLLFHDLGSTWATSLAYDGYIWGGPSCYWGGGDLFERSTLSHSMFATRLRPWSMTSTSESRGPGYITFHTLLTLLS